MILVTGGAGYIGSHTCVLLLEAGYDVLVLDNFSNSKPESMRRVETITGKKVAFVKADVRDADALRDVFRNNAVDGVIHFAGLKAVGESVSEPLMYYENNVAGSVTLAQVMAEFNVHALVFSSSATVYGGDAVSPINEDSSLTATNPYGWSKLMVEQIYRDLAASNPAWRIGLLRYFNPVGAHESGTIGEDPNGIPNNLMPNVCQVAVGRRPELKVFGDDYPTPDGTGVRDYIHVMDLAQGHLDALAWLKNNTGANVFNLGTGQGYSVLDLVKSFETASGKTVPYKIHPRRPGDSAEAYSNPTKAQKVLGWKAKRDIKAMCDDAWKWQDQNPQGYPD
ncbi:MAG: UDP-glucose 4-epimerase GalE [Methylophilaceae bacterium]